MIAGLTGKIVYKADYIILDVNGVGYEIFMSALALRDLPGLGAAVALRTYTYVREDTFALFGFLDMEEYKVFKAIISIGGFGPRIALQILSQVNSHELAAAIVSDDNERLCQIKGLGTKKAATLILELKSKLEDVACALYDKTIYSDLRSALQNLGFDIKEINYVITQLQKDILWKDGSLDKLLTQALYKLTAKTKIV
jgi:Holliday junction DNA helicase RuvA